MGMLIPFKIAIRISYVFLFVPLSLNCSCFPKIKPEILSNIPLTLRVLLQNFLNEIKKASALFCAFEKLQTFPNEKAVKMKEIYILGHSIV